MCKEQDRKIDIPKYCYSRPIVLKYKLLLSSKKKSESIKLSKFIKHINKTVCMLQDYPIVLFLFIYLFLHYLVLLE